MMISFAAETDVPEPASPTGQYPDSVWADVDYTALVEAAGAEEDPPTPTGQYPDPVWADVDYSSLAKAASVEEDLLTPPSPTGQYPDPVWTDVDYSSLAEAASAPVEQMPGSPFVELIPDSTPTTPAVALDNQEIYQIIRAVAAGISGEALYEYVDASTTATNGVRVGLMGFRQSNGELGQLLQVMQRRDPSLIAVIMGPETAELLQVTSAASREERLQPVGGQPLWHQSWQEKFRQTGRQSVFETAQNEVAIKQQFLPLLDSARTLELRSDRGLALLYDRAVALGAQTAVDWLHQYLPPANGAVEMDRLQALVQTATADTQPRLLNLLNSSLLDGTTYTY